MELWILELAGISTWSSVFERAEFDFVPLLASSGGFHCLLVLCCCDWNSD